MSYSGYYQVLCKKGHLNQLDCYSFEIDNYECECGEKMIFWNDVSTTNGEDFGFIDFSDFLLTAEERKTCNLNCEHIVEEATYRVPTDKEMEEKRTYIDTIGEEQVRRYCFNNEEVK